MWTIIMQRTTCTNVSTSFTSSLKKHQSRLKITKIRSLCKFAFFIMQYLFWEITTTISTTKNKQCRQKKSISSISRRFFDDTNRSLESLTFEHRRKMLEHVKKVDAGYDSLIQSYEQQLDEKYRGLMEELKKIVR